METSLEHVWLETSKDYECQNLSYRMIENLDFQQISHKTSFYRSDFRGTIFESDIFVENNFDLVDFISNTFKNVEFHRVNFGKAEFKNGYLRNCVFNKNIYEDIAIHGCTFTGCTFRNEIFRLTMLNCQFNHCTFINCTFDQCSTDTLVFRECVFLKCELSTMHAENFKFERCTFRDAFLGTCFLGTYLIKDTDLDLISFKYRGKIIDTHSSTFLNDLEADLLQHNRFFEHFNFSLLFHSDRLEELVNQFPQIVAKALQEPNPNVREYNLTGIFDVIGFYLGSDVIPIFYALKFFEILRQYPLSQIPPENRLCYLQHVYSLETLISSMDYSVEYILTLPKAISGIATVHCREDSITAAENFIDSLLSLANQKYLKNYYEPPYFKTISYEKGSVILTIASSLLLLLMATKVIGSVNRSLCDIRIEAAKTKKAIELINSSNTISAFQKTLAALPQKEIEAVEVQKIFDRLGNSYLIDFIIHYFLK